RCRDEQEEHSAALEYAEIVLQAELGFDSFLHASSSSRAVLRVGVSMLLSRNHDDVPALQEDVLLQIASAHDIVEPKRQCNLPASFPAQHENVVGRRECGRAAG